MLEFDLSIENNLYIFSSNIYINCCLNFDRIIMYNISKNEIKFILFLILVNQNIKILL